MNVNVLRKGLLPSSGSGIRPPPTVAGGTGGEFCVWRYKLVGDKPACFHFVAAECTSARYNNAANGYEKVGENMKWSEADARIQQLSTFFDSSAAEGAAVALAADCGRSGRQARSAIVPADVRDQLQRDERHRVRQELH